MLRTRLTELFQLDYPIMNAPMSMHCGGRLAAAVCQAGGLGSFGAANFAGADWAREQIRLVRKQTDRPFALGFVAHFMSYFEAHFEVALQERVPVMAFSFGDCSEYIRRAKENGATVMCQIQKFDQARPALAAGADILVTQGNEAGGHTGTMAMLPLLAQIVEAYPDVPVLAAGGIASGRSLAAVLAAGAEGAWVGTAFLATPEVTEISEAYKQIIVNGRAEDTTYSSVFDTIETRFFNIPDWLPGIAARLYRNTLVREWEGREAQLAEHIADVLPRYSDARGRRDPELTAVYMGQSASFVNSIRPAQEVLTVLGNDAEKILRQRTRTLLG